MPLNIDSLKPRCLALGPPVLLTREVADALAVRGTVEEQLSAQQSLVSATAETYRISEARYTKGVDSYLSVLDAQRSLYAAQRVLVALSLENLINQVHLYAVLGGGAE